MRSPSLYVGSNAAIRMNEGVNVLTSVLVAICRTPEESLCKGCPGIPGQEAEIDGDSCNSQAERDLGAIRCPQIGRQF